MQTVRRPTISHNMDEECFKKDQYLKMIYKAALFIHIKLFLNDKNEHL